MYSQSTTDGPIDFSRLKEFPLISPAAFQHPRDVKATAALEKIPLLKTVVQKMHSFYTEKEFEITLNANAIRLSQNQGGSIYKKFVKAAKILGLPEASLPQIYLSSELNFNAFSMGVNKYFIVLYAPLVDSLTEEELLAVIAHELGHIKCRHQLYKSIAEMLFSAGEEMLGSVLGIAGKIISSTIGSQLYNWYRAAELSCDRAALLVVQDPLVVASTLSKLAGGSRKILPEINVEGILQQAQDYEEVDTKVGKFIKFMMRQGQTHPYPIIRVKEIMEWGNSADYQNIMAGKYQKETPQLPGAPAGFLASPSVICPHCNQVVMASGAFCYHCGKRLEEPPRLCVKCSEPIIPDARFCAVCGTATEVQA